MLKRVLRSWTRKCLPEEDLRRVSDEAGDHQGGVGKKETMKPGRRRDLRGLARLAESKPRWGFLGWVMQPRQGFESQAGVPRVQGA